MSDGVRYLDSSALVKLVLSERESAALARWLGPRPAAISSEVAVIEVTRAVRLADERSQIEEHSSRLLEEIALVQLSRDLLEQAALVGPRLLRALDAIHLATALFIRPDAFVAYDERLLRAAADAGLKVASPGA